MSLRIEDADSGGGRNVGAPENQLRTVRRPPGIGLRMIVIWQKFLRAAAVRRDQVDPRGFPGGHGKKRYLLAVGRPARQGSIERRIAQLQPLAAIEFAAPQR